MIRTIATLAALLALAAGTAAASSSPTRTVHFYGDSIHKGWGFGDYADASPLNRIDRIATMLATANGKPGLRFRRTGTQEPAAICRDVLTGRVRAGDRIVFEDAGPHTDRADARTGWLDLVVYCATKAKRRPAVTLTLSTMFDYSPDPVGTPLSTYDETLPDGSGLTANAVTRRVAARSGARLLDWNRQMDAAHAALEPLGVHVVHPDGIHPTVWGNVILAISLLRSEGVEPANLEPVVAELLAARTRIVARGMSPDFDTETARGWLALASRTSR